MFTLPRDWWRVPVGREERLWVGLAFLLAVVFFSAFMGGWHTWGRQNAVGEAYKIDPKAFREEVYAFAERHQVGVEHGIPVVAPPPGADVYLLAQAFSWYPILKLEAGVSYRLHASALDFQHGLSLHPHEWAIQLYPGYEWVYRFTPTHIGVYHLVCNEYCGLGHHFMVGKLIVKEQEP